MFVCMYYVHILYIILVSFLWFLMKSAAAHCTAYTQLTRFLTFICGEFHTAVVTIFAD